MASQSNFCKDFNSSKAFAEIVMIFPNSIFVMLSTAKDNRLKDNSFLSDVFSRIISVWYDHDFALQLIQMAN